MNKYTQSLGMQAVRNFGNLQTRRLHAGGWASLFPVVVAVAFGMGYVIVVNQTSAQGFELRDLENRIEQTQTENRKLEVRIAELQSLDSIQSRLEGQGFVPVARIDYLTPGAPVVALK